MVAPFGLGARKRHGAVWSRGPAGSQLSTQASAPHPPDVPDFGACERAEAAGGMRLNVAGGGKRPADSDSRAAATHEGQGSVAGGGKRPADSGSRAATEGRESMPAGHDSSALYTSLGRVRDDDMED